MRLAMMAIVGVLLGSGASAAQTYCSGSYFGYDFSMHAISANGVVTGPMTVVVSSGGSVVKSETLKVSSSDIRTKQYIRVSGAGSEGSGSLDASYDSGSDTYNGNMNAQTSFGQVGVDVSCTLKGAALFTQQYIKYQPILLFSQGFRASAK